MATDAKIGLLVPAGFSGTPPSMAEFNGFFRGADELGYDSLWSSTGYFTTSTSSIP